MSTLLRFEARRSAQLYSRTNGKLGVTSLVVPDQELLQEGRSLVDVIPRQNS